MVKRNDELEIGKEYSTYSRPQEKTFIGKLERLKSGLAVFTNNGYPRETQIYKPYTCDEDSIVCQDGEFGKKYWTKEVSDKVWPLGRLSSFSPDDSAYFWFHEFSEAMNREYIFTTTLSKPRFKDKESFVSHGSVGHTHTWEDFPGSETENPYCPGSTSFQKKLKWYTELEKLDPTFDPTLTQKLGSHPLMDFLYG